MCAAWLQNHLQACTECQGRSGLGSTGFATYPVMEKDDPVRLLPEKHTLEKPMPDQPSEADKGTVQALDIGSLILK